MALQYGVPLKILCAKFSHTRFEPSGWTTIKEIGYAKSITDYLARWLALTFLPPTSPPHTGAEAASAVPVPVFPQSDAEVANQDGSVCEKCGAIMARNGSGRQCANCGAASAQESTTGEVS